MSWEKVTQVGTFGEAHETKRMATKSTRQTANDMILATGANGGFTTRGALVPAATWAKTATDSAVTIDISKAVNSHITADGLTGDRVWTTPTAAQFRTYFGAGFLQQTDRIGTAEAAASVQTATTTNSFATWFITIRNDDNASKITLEGGTDVTFYNGTKDVTAATGGMFVFHFKADGTVEYTRAI